MRGVAADQAHSIVDIEDQHLRFPFNQGLFAKKDKIVGPKTLNSQER